MRGILLVNTGSPRSVNRKDVRAFIEAMLSDPLVMTVPDWFRILLVKGIIGPFRQFSSAKHYSQIWDNEHDASPLSYHMQQLAMSLADKSELPVEIAMRYLQPDISTALDKLLEKEPCLHEVVVLPLFPQYAESSYQTVVDEFGRVFYQKPYPFRLKVIEPYYNHPAYIEALSRSIQPIMEEYDKLLFSFHSLPISHVEKGWGKGKDFDYVYQSKETVRLLINKLNVDINKTRQTYHSAMSGGWIGPALNDMIINLAKGGDKSIAVIAPGFAMDNLETLFDINIEAKELFLKNGGVKFDYIPCLNSSDYWVDAILKMIN